MARLNLPIVSMILNNDTLGWIKHIQKSRYQERYISCDFNHIDFETVARGFGVRSYTAASLEDVSRIMAAESSPQGPALIDVGIDPWATPVLRNASGPD
jgi:acetolactate synthase-1/2/3 large subunit